MGLGLKFLWVVWSNHNRYVTAAVPERLVPDRYSSSLSDKGLDSCPGAQFSQGKNKKSIVAVT